VLRVDPDWERTMPGDDLFLGDGVDVPPAEDQLFPWVDRLSLSTHAEPFGGIFA
jgi:hypothetical protein